MKNFLVTFFVCMVMMMAFFFFAGALIFSSTWGILIFVSLVITVIVCLFDHQSTQIEELKQRIEQMEAVLGQKGEECV